MLNTTYNQNFKIIIILITAFLFLNFVKSANAAGLWMGGAETDSTGEVNINTGTPVISSSTVHSGGYSYETNGSNVSFYAKHYPGGTNPTSIYSRSYMNFTALPSAANVIEQVVNTSSGGIATLELNTNGTLTAKNGSSTGTVVGTSSTALSANTWYRIDFKVVVSATVGIIEVRVNGSVVISAINQNTGTTAIGSDVYGPRLTSQDIFWDDIYEDDSAYAPDGKVIARQPIIGTPTYNSWTKTGADPYWADTPTNTSTYATSVNGTNVAQTKLIGSFSTTQSGHGSEIIGIGDTVNSMYVVNYQKRGSGGAQTYSIRVRVGGTDTDTAVTLTTSDDYYESTFSSPTLSNLNSMEAGGVYSGSNALYTIEDLWVMVDYTPQPVLDHYLVTIATPQTAGVCSTGTNTVTAKDSLNNTVTTDSSTVNMTSSNNTIIFYADSGCNTPTMQYTLSSGVANIYYKITLAQPTTITATEYGSTPTGTSSSITVNPSTMAYLIVTLPGQIFTQGFGNSGTASYQIVEKQFTISYITATDAYFNTVTTYTGSKTLAYSGPGGSPSYTTSVSFTSGQSTTTLLTTLVTAETTRITVKDTGSYGYPSSYFNVLTVLNQVNIKGGTKIKGGSSFGNPLVCQPFSTVNQAQLPNPLDYTYATPIMINGNSYFYVVGGSNGTTYYNTVLKGTVGANGNVASLTASGQGTLGLTLRGGCSTTATDGTNNYLFSLAGCGNPNCVTNTYGGAINSTGDVPTLTSQTAMPNNIGLYESCTSLNINGTAYVYTLGGGDASNGVAQTYVAKTAVTGGGLGTWSNTTNQLPVATQLGVSLSAKVGGSYYIYYLGGTNTSGTVLSTVYKASINSSTGDVFSAFSTTNQGQLPIALDYFTAQIVSVNGNQYVYVLGGNTASNGYSNYNFMAPILPNGDIGTFTTVNQSQLPVGIRNDASAWGISGGNTYLYLIGGETGTIQSTVYKAQVSGTGGY